jgi:Cys-tRNA(Pro)/Cys-tRNA(Cys) deacylase
VTGHEQAIAAVISAGVDHRVVEYGEVRSLEEAAQRRSIDVHRLLKTMVVRRDEDDYVLVLVPGDRTIDWAKLRAHLGVRRLSFATEEEATAATGYVHGAITPLGAGPWPVVTDAAVPADGEVSLGGGRRGVAIHVAGADLPRLVGPVRADVTRPVQSTA